MLTYTKSSFGRIGLWLGCCLLAVAVFSLILGPRGSVDVGLRIGLLFVLPICLLYLPLIIKLRDAEHRRIWIILTSGILIGPAVLFLWSLILILRGGSAHAIWQGDPLVPSSAVLIGFAAIVGLIMTSVYALSLKALHRSSATA